jgi:hydroxymethylpyrimidine/phosphomethylpyrimidine kinase
MAPRVLAIGGLDPTGGAGLTADALAIAACGGRPSTVPTCLTVQNRHGFMRLEPVDPGLLRAMLDAVLQDGRPQAIKVGLLGSAAVARSVATWLMAHRSRTTPVVVDPVLSATAGGWEAGEGVVAALRDSVLLAADYATPNLPELARLVPDSDARRLLALGLSGVVVKGGHAEGETVRDTLVTAQAEVLAEGRRLPRGKVHGTGCAFASAFATALAAGKPAAEALQLAHAFVRRCLVATEPSVDGLPVPLEIVAPG